MTFIANMAVLGQIWILLWYLTKKMILLWYLLAKYGCCGVKIGYYYDILGRYCHMGYYYEYLVHLWHLCSNCGYSGSQNRIIIMIFGQIEYYYGIYSKIWLFWVKIGYYYDILGRYCHNWILLWISSAFMTFM